MKRCARVPGPDGGGCPPSAPASAATALCWKSRDNRAMKARTLEPEWLDSLPEQDARAQRSRRDLARVNALMGSASIVARLLRDRLPARPLRIAEIGSGDGAFAARMVRRLHREGEIVLV